ncbi:hypothetical protein MLD38_039912 [Melastoma candidum]|uniref:Uncharacterized protein n=1 Tax=Melastoma candidum TaxID=119954 RepID=A0ACB9L409_9MYRT|nr:hypothetical protein MLD38_039912 [Melastoma candidum]
MTDQIPPPNDSHSQPPRVPSSARHQEQFSGHHIRYPNLPDAANPDPVTLRDQRRFATRQYSRWYGHAWGTAIVAGVAFFVLGWFIKGGNPLPTSHDDSRPRGSSSESESKGG